MSEKLDSVIVLVPILNFDCEETSVKLDETLLVRRAHTDEIENMIKQFPNYQMLKSALGDTKFLIEKRGSSEEVSNMYFSPETADAQRIKTAFRLLNIDETSMPTSFYVSAVSLFISNPYPKRNTSVGSYHVLPKEQIGEFKALWKALKKADNGNLKPFVNFIARCVEQALDIYLNAIEPSTKKNQFMTLAEASKLTPYSKEYLGLLARKGMIGATKIGRNWHITQEALDQYLAEAKPKICKTDKLKKIQHMPQ